MPKRKRTYKRKKTGLELLAAILVAIGAILCIILGVLCLFGECTYAYAFLIDVFPVNLVLAIVFGVIIIVIEGYNRLNDYWSIIGIFILAIFAATLGAILIIVGVLFAIIEKVRKE